MDLFHHFYKLHSILEGRRTPISRIDLERKLEVSTSTIKRIVQELRNYGIPIEYSREQNGYSLNPDIAYELPGMWFAPDEICALITAHDLLTNAEPGLLKETLSPLKAKLDKLLAQEHLGAGELPKRVRIIRIAGRGSGKCFARVAQALVERKRISFDYAARTTGSETWRTVSPQRLTHYRDNWYLDAWCHLRKGIRSFALEHIENAKIKTTNAQEMSEAELHQHFASSYGIFAGEPKATARLIFSAHRARWVAEEIWHPAQKSEHLPDGRYQLDIPYSDERELLMDILKHGSDVEVISPPQLRASLVKTLNNSLTNYANSPNPAPDKALGDVTV